LGTSQKGIKQSETGKGPTGTYLFCALTAKPSDDINRDPGLTQRPRIKNATAIGQIRWVMLLVGAEIRGSQLEASLRKSLVRYHLNQ
jgi:hypothetical protein